MHLFTASQKDRTMRIWHYSEGLMKLVERDGLRTNEVIAFIDTNDILQDHPAL